MCEKTKHDVLARMALVPRTLEARGLDATPLIQAKLRRVNTPDATRAVEFSTSSCADEVGHVAIGNHWYRWALRAEGLDPEASYPRWSRIRRAAHPPSFQPRSPRPRRFQRRRTAHAVRQRHPFMISDQTFSRAELQACLQDHPRTPAFRTLQFRRMRSGRPGFARRAIHAVPIRRGLVCQNAANRHPLGRMPRAPGRIRSRRSHQCALSGLRSQQYAMDARKMASAQFAGSKLTGAQFAEVSALGRSSRTPARGCAPARHVVSQQKLELLDFSEAICRAAIS